MLELLIWIVVFIVSLFVLIKASHYFTDSAEKIGLFFGLPAFLIGVTIVSVGTSLPELVSSIFAVIRGSSEIVVSNVVGSNIANILLILGIVSIVGKKMKIAYELSHVDIPILIGSAFLFTVMIWDGVFTLPEALLSILGIIIYLLYTVSSEKEHEDIEIKKEMKEELLQKKELTARTVIMLIIGIVFVYLGAKYTIESVIKLSEMLSIGKELIAVSAISIGTSLPELAVSFAAARKGKSEIAIGNILGSNIFNTFVVMAIPSFFGALTIPQNMLTLGLPMMLISTLMFFFITRDNEITKWEGYMLLILYVLFIGKLFNLF